MKDLNSLRFCIEKCDFWFVWHFSHEICNKVMSHDPALLAKIKMLLLYPNMIPWPITNSPVNCELFQNSLTWIFYNLFSFILPLLQLFGVLQPSKMCLYLQKAFKLVSKNFGNLFFVLLSIKQKFKRTNKSQTLDFIAFYKMSKLFLIWGCNILLVTCR